MAGARPEWMKELGHETVMCCPISCHDETLGVLFIGSSPLHPFFVESDLNLIRGLAPVLGMSLRNASLARARVKEHL
jgi:GAF domain-containing protein